MLFVPIFDFQINDIYVNLKIFPTIWFWIKFLERCCATAFWDEPIEVKKENIYFAERHHFYKIFSSFIILYRYVEFDGLFERNDETFVPEMISLDHFDN